MIFLTSSIVAGLELQQDALSRFTVQSSYVTANVEIVHYDAVMEMTSFLAVAERRRNDDAGKTLWNRRMTETLILILGQTPDDPVRYAFVESGNVLLADSGG